MASRSRNRSASRTTPLALEMLEADHEKVLMMFEQYEEEKEADEETKRELAERICNELTVHAQVEEELFYPWLRENLDDAELVEEATVEHATAKDLIAQIQGSSGVDETYDARVKVLGEYVKHHIQEERNEIFSEVRGRQEELDELGQEMFARKADLMEQLGIMPDVEEAAMMSGGRSRRSQAGAQRGR